MTSPKTVTPDQPQAVPDDVRALAEKSATQWYGWRAETTASWLHVRGLFSAAILADRAARPVLPVETPAEGLREAADVSLQMLGDGRFYDEDGGEWEMTQETYEKRTANCQCSHCIQRRDTTPAPLSGRDGSLREAQVSSTGVLREWFGGERYARDYEYLDANFGKQARQVADWVNRAALAAVPPETAEMEGETARLTRELNYVRGRREYWKQKAIEAAEDERDRLFAETMNAFNHSGRDERYRTTGIVLGEWGAMLPAKRDADRLAARASSSGEAGDA